MKTRKSLAMALTVVIALAAGVLLVWQFTPQNVADQPVALDAPAPAAAPETSSGDVALTAQQMDDRLIANTIASDAGDTLSSDTEMVMGLRVKKDRDCVVTLHYLPQPDGSLMKAFSCVEISVTPRAMAHYTDAALKELAYSDAVASYELGRRMITREGQQEEATQYLLRSIALDTTQDNKWLSPIYEITSERFSNQFSEEHGLNMRRNAYVFHSLAATLDESYNWKKQMGLERLLDAGLDLAQIAELENETLDLLDSLIEIQMTVMGESAIAARLGS